MTVGEPKRYKTPVDAGCLRRPLAYCVVSPTNAVINRALSGLSTWSNPTVFPVHLVIGAGVPQEIQKAAATLANNNCAPVSKVSLENAFGAGHYAEADRSFDDYTKRKFGNGNNYLNFYSVPRGKLRIFVALSIGSSDKLMVCGFYVSSTAQDISQYMKTRNSPERVELNISDKDQNLIFSESQCLDRVGQCGAMDPLILVNFNAVRWFTRIDTMLLYADIPSDQFSLVVDIPLATLKDAASATVKFTQ